MSMKKEKPTRREDAAQEAATGTGTLPKPAQQVPEEAAPVPQNGQEPGGGGTAEGNEDAAQSTAVSEEPGQAGAPPQAEKNIVEKFYDKLPFTYKQVDIFVKVLIGVLIVALAAAVLFGRQ